MKVLNGSTQYVYVFEVQVSNYRPHQYKHIYYARLDGQTRPAPHYLVEALMRRITYPNIEAYLKVTDSKLEKIHGVYSYILGIEIIVCNFSELQNEENILLDVTVGPGTFREWNANSEPIEQYSQEEHRLRIVDFTKTLHFGLHAVRPETVIIPRDELSGNKELSIGTNEIMIVILFGGKYSPAKSSHYVIDVTRTVTNYDYNSLIVRKEENVTMADGQRAKGTKKEDFLRDYLAR